MLKGMIKKVLLPVLLTVLCVLSCSMSDSAVVSAASSESASVKLDFKEFAIAASEQDWWADLQPAADSNTMYIGCKSYGVEMSSEVTAAYEQMRTFTKERFGWWIDESACRFSNTYFMKQLYINCAKDIPWGISHYPTYLSLSERNKLQIVFEVETAGWYHMDLQAFHESTTGAYNTTATTGVYYGSGYGDIYINGERIYQDYYFGSETKTITNGLGAVYLNSGENTLMIASVKDFAGGQSSSRRLINLRSVEFSPLGDVYIETAHDNEVDLTQNYLPFDAVLSSGTHTVTSENTAIAKPKIDGTGKLIITGVKEGRTNITLYKNGTEVVTFPVTVVESMSAIEDLTRVSYLVDGFEAEALKYGQVGVGTLTGISNLSKEYDIDVVRRAGDIYFMSDNTSVAKVDQTDGSVTCVGEGSARIHVYVQVDGVLLKDYVDIVVTDDTDLASITIDTSADYVGTGNTLQLSATGKKASGAKADMDNFPVSYTIDDESVACIDENGRLVGLKPGTVTVTATAGVARTAITDTMLVTVVDNTELKAGDMILDLTDGRCVAMETATLEEDGMQINRDLTVSGGSTLSYTTKHGILLSSPKLGDKLAIDFTIEKDGWYVIETWGTLFTYGGIADVFVDDVYVGVMDFNQGKNLTYSGNSIMNTIYLEAGVHTCVYECTTRGTFSLGKFICRATSDPNEMEITFNAKNQLLIGESLVPEVKIKTANEKGTYTLKCVSSSATPDYTNYYSLSSSNAKVVSVSGNTLTAVAKGTAVITLNGEIGNKAIKKTLSVSVMNGSVYSVELTAGKTTLAPTSSGTSLSLLAYKADGTQISLPSGASVSYSSGDTSVAKVSSAGKVTVTGKEGSAEITATVTENGRTMSASIWITVTTGKTEPTLFTYEERANAIENVSKYSWAANLKTTAVRNADKVLTYLDTYYDNFIYQAFPRSTRVGTRTDPEAYYCRYCGKDLAATYGVYPWIVDPLTNPWKITCPACKRDFPSNDFESYYKSGLGEDGRFYPENADSQYLVNELYPEMGAGWGVDDGFGYDTGNTYSNGAKEIHTYIGYYMHCVFDSLSSTAKNDMLGAITALQDAYLYTGDEKYGSAGAILLDRIADIYPEYDYYTYDGFDKGKIVNAIWEASSIGQTLAKAADAFWPAMDNADVIAYLRAHAAWKGVSAEQITPEYIRNNVDEGILLQIRDACLSAKNLGNFGMHQASMAYAAVALDRLPETKEMIDWIFRAGENKTLSARELYVTGGSVLDRLVNDVDRDGFGNEGSMMYNPMWYQNLMSVADALNGYTRVEGVDLWKNPKFVSMFNPYNKIILCGTASVNTGESGNVQSYGTSAQPSYMLEAFINSGDRELSRGLYFANKNSVSGLHASIFTKDPEAGIRSAILKIVEEDGEWIWNRSEMLCGHGLAILRNGPEVFQKGVNDDQFSDYWMFFGMCGGTHGAHEALTIGIEAFGIISSPTLGYPKVVNAQDPERMQWMRNTVSHNTVVVDDKCQHAISKNSFPLHFEDVGEVKIADASAPNAYDEADIYRRTLVSVQAQENVYYAVDFFRVLGGSEHVYSFHAASTIEPETEGLSFVHQAMGTYAGPEVAFGNWYSNPYSTDAAANTGSGYSWLDNVYRDDEPENTFSVDFEIEDFRDVVINSEGVRMRLTMVSEEPMTEVAVADGHPTQNGRNPEILKYLLVRRSGKKGMDTLFTSVIQPYRDVPYIESTQLLDVEVVSGKEAVTDRAAAMKVTLTSGRTDYIIYATNPDVTYSILDDGQEFLQFCGFTGVCSVENGEITYAYGSEVRTMTNADGVSLVMDGLQRVEGEVIDFTKGLADTYSMTISMETPVTAEDLAGKYIYVDNDGAQNGAYQIYGAQVNGDTAVLDLNKQTLTRSYIDGTDPSKGFIHNIAEGQTFSIPLSAEVSCFHKRNRVSYTGNGDGTHTVTRTCTNCGVVTSESIAACKDGSDADTNCDKCGGKISQIEKVTVAGSNMNLGNELQVNFIVPNLPEGGVYTAYIHQQTEEEAGVTHEIPMEQWSVFDATRTRISVRVRAMEMTDALTITIKDADGNFWSEEYTTSVRDYAGKALAAASSTSQMKTLVVDMVNYGAAAQTNFGYKADDLANNQLTDAQKALATGTVVCANNQIKGTNNIGSNLALDDCILLNVYFQGLKGKDMSTITAKVSFTNWKDEYVEVEIPGTEFELYGATGDRYKVKVDDIVLADAKCLVTVELYEDGIEAPIAYGSDSVESYANRGSATAAAPLYNAIMKFATSAKAYLLSRQ
ncbi:MAG: Ig-like domain-containing protein [Oscillospiraceae bacterium]|nr:Ig-like domain-containing protein [Oscillospiraceae bacterium]